eukprot:g4979.t1
MGGTEGGRLNRRRARRKRPRLLANDDGADLRCVAAVPRSNQIVIASRNSDAIYFFTPDLRGRCYLFDNPKTFLFHLQNSKLLLVESVARARENLQQLRHVDIYDLEHRVVAFHLPLRRPSRLLFVVEAWGRILLVTSTHEIIELREKNTDAKLEHLFRLGLFDIAKSLAAKASRRASGRDFGGEEDGEEVEDRNKMCGGGDENATVAHRKYADYLYDVGDFDGATRHYIASGNTVEASYVIERLLFSQRLSNLADYLEALHASGRCTTEHTELLLGCYFKLKASERISNFVTGRVGNRRKRSSSSSNKSVAAGSDYSPFDVDAAIGALRLGGYGKEAMTLSRLHQRHALHLRMMIEDEKDFEAAVRHIQQLPRKDAVAYVRRYGATLLENVPEDALRLFWDICDVDRAEVPSAPTMSATRSENGTRTKKNEQLDSLSQRPPPRSATRNVSTLTQDAREAVERAAALIFGSRRPSPREDVTKTRVVVEKRNESKRDDDDDDDDTTPKRDVAPLSNFAVSRVVDAGQFVACFSSSTKNLRPLLLRFLLGVTNLSAEVAVSSSSSSSIQHSSDVWNVLLELLLERRSTESHVAATDSDDRRPMTEKLIMDILRNHRTDYDAHHALMLVQTFNFESGYLYMLEAMNMYGALLDQWIERGDVENAVRCCDRFASPDNQLWTRLLVALASDNGGAAANEGSSVVKRRDEHLRAVLKRLSENGELAPTEVLNILSRNSRVGVETALPFVLDALESQELAIKRMDDDIQRRFEASQRMRREVNEFRAQRRIDFATPSAPSSSSLEEKACARCNLPLDLPVVHFVSGHSYHARCCAYGESSDAVTCPALESQIEKVRRIKEKLERKCKDISGLSEDIEKADDGFAKIAEYFGMGIFRGAAAEKKNIGE